MANMSLKKNPMPSQDPNVRNKNFDEVALGYTEEMAIDEAQRCLNCKNPKCVNGCPVNVHIPEFIAKVAEGKFDEAFGVITSTNSLPAICGRVCPQENQCEGQCIRGIKGEPVASASAASRANPWASAVWSGSWPTTTTPTATPAALPPCRRATATRWRWWAPAPPA